VCGSRVIEDVCRHEGEHGEEKLAAYKSGFGFEGPRVEFLFLLEQADLSHVYQDSFGEGVLGVTGKPSQRC